MKTLKNTKHRSSKTRLSREGGATFVEVLTSLLILSFGSLGAASLQITSKQAAYDAQQMLSATFLTNGIVERMRNNPGALDVYASADVGNGSIALEPMPNCVQANPCNSAQLALHDLWVWEQSIDGESMKSGDKKVGGLVNPKGCIINDNGRVQVIVSWHGMDSLSDAASVSGGMVSCGTETSHRRQIVVNTFIE